MTSSFEDLGIFIDLLLTFAITWSFVYPIKDNRLYISAWLLRRKNTWPGSFIQIHPSLYNFLKLTNLCADTIWKIRSYTTVYASAYKSNRSFEEVGYWPWTFRLVTTGYAPILKLFSAMRHIYPNHGESDIKVYGAGLLQLVRKASDLGFSIVGNGEDFWAKNNDLGSMGYILR